MFLFIEATISYLSKLQLIVILFIWKPEFIAIFEAKKEAIWLEYLLFKLRF